MTKREFLNRLKEALENGLDSRTVQENMDYYRSYIEEETGQGRSEEEVLEELGDPWVIAQSVISMAESRSATEGVYGSGDGYGEGRSGDSDVRGYPNMQIHTHAVSGWRMLLFVLGVIGIVLIVFAVIGGLISLIMPMLVPILVIVLLVRLIKRIR